MSKNKCNLIGVNLILFLSSLILKCSYSSNFTYFYTDPLISNYPIKTIAIFPLESKFANSLEYGSPSRATTYLYNYLVSQLKDIKIIGHLELKKFQLEQRLKNLTSSDSLTEKKSHFVISQKFKKFYQKNNIDAVLYCKINSISTWPAVENQTICELSFYMISVKDKKTLWEVGIEKSVYSNQLNPNIYDALVAGIEDIFKTFPLLEKNRKAENK